MQLTESLWPLCARWSNILMGGTLFCLSEHTHSCQCFSLRWWWWQWRAAKTSYMPKRTAMQSSHSPGPDHNAGPGLWISAQVSSCVKYERIQNIEASKWKESVAASELIRLLRKAQMCELHCYYKTPYPWRCGDLWCNQPHRASSDSESGSKVRGKKEREDEQRKKVFLYLRSDTMTPVPLLLSPPIVPLSTQPSPQTCLLIYPSEIKTIYLRNRLANIPSIIPLKNKWRTEAKYLSVS